MPNLMPIGRFSQLCRLSIKTLRYYDQVGLLHPAEIDPWTHYRYYTLEQAVIAERIRLLRTTNMPIEDIRLLLAARNDSEAEPIVARHREQLHQRLQETHHAIEVLERLLPLEKTVLPYDICLRDTTACPIAAIRRTITWDEIDTTVSALMQEIMGYLYSHQRTQAGASVVLYHTIHDEGMECEVGMPVAAPIEETDQIKNSVVPGGLAAYTLHQGSYEELGAAHRALQAWIQMHGHGMAGPSYEVYLMGPLDTSDNSQYKTECYWSIQ